LLWRLSRAACDKGKMSSDADFKKACIYEAFEYIKRALELNKENFACNKVTVIKYKTIHFKGK